MTPIRSQPAGLDDAPAFVLDTEGLRLDRVVPADVHRKRLTITPRAPGTPLDSGAAPIRVFHGLTPDVLTVAELTLGGDPLVLTGDDAIHAVYSDGAHNLSTSKE